MVSEQRPSAIQEGLGCIFLTAALALYSIVLAHFTGSPTSLWLANGAAIGWVVRKPLSKNWSLFIAAFLGYLAVRLVLGESMLASVFIGACNVVEMVIVGIGVRLHLPTTTNESSISKMATAAFVSALIGCAICAFFISLVQDFQPRTPVHWTTFSTLFRSHLLGMVIAGTTSFFVLTKNSHPFGPRKGRVDLILNLLLLTATTLFVFTQAHYPLLFLVYPALLLLIFRHRFSGMLLGVAVIALITTAATAFKFGPFELVIGATADVQVVMAQIFIGTCCLVAVPVALALVEQKRLQRLFCESELRYRMLADNSGDLVMRIQPDGDRQYVSPSIKDLLGWEVRDFLKPRPDLIHPEDRRRIEEVVIALRTNGGTITATYRLMHRDGDYRWIEALMRLVDSPDSHGATDIIYSGRDVTKRILVEQALFDSRAQLRTISDNIPAVIARIDLSETYTYINRFVEQISGKKQSDIVGRTVKDVRGSFLYEQLRHKLSQAFSGESVFLEYEAMYGGQRVHFQTHYVPDTDMVGNVRGAYALTTNITHIKDVERELSRLAHYDSLTGLANRRYFHDRAPLLIETAHKQHGHVLLVLLDIDHFKTINDTWGHAAGDAVLTEIGHRLRKVITETFLVARLGGDEFVILCSDYLNEIEATAFVQSLWSELQVDIVTEGVRIDVNVCIGAVLSNTECSRSVLMKWADEALYEAKGSGRNTYRVIFKGNDGGSNNAL